MRIPSFYLLFGALSLVRAASPVEDDVDASVPNTIFNHEEVPPMMELTPDNYESTIAAHKFVMIKHYSPYCHHCLSFAPTYQTAYEFYYTMKDSRDAKKTFTEGYDFVFASLNCVAYGDLCTTKEIASYPTTHLYYNGKLEGKVKGAKDMTAVTGKIEQVVEAAFPGTRPVEVLPPVAGASESPDYATESKSGKVELVKDAADAKDVAAAPGAAAGVKDVDAAPGAKPAGVPAAKPDVVKKPPTIPYAAAEPPKPTGPPPNHNGLSVSLTADTFMQQVVATGDPWFIKFYAPWCHHCQAMGPNWLQMAKEMKGRLNIGEVNCDKEAKLCADARLNGYPTMLFFKGGERVEYDGLRGFGDLMQYAERALEASSGVPDVDLASFEKMETKEDVIFVYFYDLATTSEDFMALNRLPLSLINRARLVKTQDPKMYERFKITTWPRLIVSREGHPTYFTPLMPSEMRDVPNVLNWMKSVWLPIVPELTASNAREIMDGKIVVLGVLNREDQETFMGALREMKSAANEWMERQIKVFQMDRQALRDAKQLRIEEAEDRNDQRALRNAKNIRINMDMSSHKQVSFAWVDSIFWQRWLRTTYGIDTKSGDRVIINDEDNRRYWDTTITGNNIVPSRTSILETITKVTSSPPDISPKYTVGNIQKVFYQLKLTTSEHPYLCVFALLASVVGGVTWFRGRGRALGSRARSLSLAAEAGKIRVDNLLGGNSVSAGGKQD